MNIKNQESNNGGKEGNPTSPGSGGLSIAFDSAMRIFEITNTFPSEERFSLTDQIRRASRSVCSNIAEGWRKRKYIAAFVNKMTDAMQEASETQCWLEFACEYIDQTFFDELDTEHEKILAMLNSMERNANKFCF